MSPDWSGPGAGRTRPARPSTGKPTGGFTGALGGMPATRLAGPIQAQTRITMRPVLTEGWRFSGRRRRRMGQTPPFSRRPASLLCARHAAGGAPFAEGCRPARSRTGAPWTGLWVFFPCVFRSGGREEHARQEGGRNRRAAPIHSIRQSRRVQHQGGGATCGRRRRPAYFAPCARSRRAASSKPLVTAACRGLAPDLFVALMSAPFAISSSSTPARPHDAAS